MAVATRSASVTPALQSFDAGLSAMLKGIIATGPPLAALAAMNERMAELQRRVQQRQPEEKGGTPGTMAKAPPRPPTAATRPVSHLGVAGLGWPQGGV